MKTSGCYTVAGRPLAGGFCSRTGDVLSHAMYSAARNGHSQVVEYLLDRGAAIDAKGLRWYRRTLGSHQRHRNTVDLLIARGASLTIRDVRFNSTPVNWGKEG